MTEGDAATPEDGEKDESELSELSAAMSQTIGKLTLGEQLVALGAIIYLFVDLFGNVFFDEYNIEQYLIVGSVVVLMLIVGRRMRETATPIAYGWLLTAVSLVVALGGAREFVGDLDATRLGDGGATVFFALVFYAGVVLFWVGLMRTRKLDA